MRGSAWCQEDFTAGGVAALSLVHGIVPWWLLQCMAWYGVGALVKPTAAAIRRLCLRPVTWWEPAGSAHRGPSRGCQAAPHSGTTPFPIWTRTGSQYGPAHTLLLLPAGGEASFACHSSACKHLIFFN